MCIVDEAAQLTLPVCVGPLRFATTFVLVGDHYQLPPLVRNETAKEGGLDVSLFQMLAEAHPNAVVSLSRQYRMTEDIMRLSNELIYANQLQCANESVRRKALTVPSMWKLDALHQQCPHRSSFDADGGVSCAGGSECWLGRILDPE